MRGRIPRLLLIDISFLLHRPDQVLQVAVFFNFQKDINRRLSQKPFHSRAADVTDPRHLAPPNRMKQQFLFIFIHLLPFFLMAAQNDGKKFPQFFIGHLCKIFHLHLLHCFQKLNKVVKHTLRSILHFSENEKISRYKTAYLSSASI